MKGLFIGLTAIDVIYPLKCFPKENAKVRAEGDHMDIGGPATNAAYAFAALGGEATVVSWLGKHSLSTFIKDKLEAYSINHLDLNPSLEKDPVVSCVILNTKSASRTIVTAKVDMDIPVVPPPIDINEYDIICIDGFFGDYVLEILKENNRKIPVVFDGGSHKSHTDVILPWVDYPIFSGHFRAPNENQLGQYLESFALNTYAVTQGENPIFVVDQGETSEIEVQPTEAIDTLAAGDIFHGAFTKFILENNSDFGSALKQAAKIASLSCRFIGPRRWANDL